MVENLCDSNGECAQKTVFSELSRNRGFNKQKQTHQQTHQQTVMSVNSIGECKTADEIYRFLMDRLFLIPNQPPILEQFNGHEWQTVSGFRNYYFFYNVFKNPQTQEYAFHVGNGECYELDKQNFPSWGFGTSYETVVRNAANKMMEYYAGFNKN